MATAIDSGNDSTGTRLYFGSAVVPRRSARAGKPSLGPLFSALLGFHKLYSRILLRAARSRLVRGRRDAPRADRPRT